MFLSFDKAKASTDRGCSSGRQLVDGERVRRGRAYRIRIQSTTYESTRRFDICFTPLTRFRGV